jgi:uroporphyrinogen-III decarboxylase
VVIEPNPRGLPVNSKERIARVMRNQKPDRVPVMCQLSLGHYFLQCPIPCIEIWHSTEGFAEALIGLQQRYCFDGILINLPGRDPAWRSHIRRIEERGGEKIIYWNNNWTTVCPPDDNPHVFRENGERYQASFDELDPDRLFYVEPHDIKGLDYPYTWGFSGELRQRTDFFPPWQYDTIDYVVSRVGKSVSVHGEIFSPFSQFLELLGCASAMMALIDDAEKCEACLAALAEGAIALGRAQAAHGVDAILISSAFAGAGFLSPAHYRRFVLPFERTVVRGIKDFRELPLYTHTCGAIGDRLELMAETGTNGIDTLDPPPLGNVELRDAKGRIGSRLFIKGNLDPVNTLLKGSRAGVRMAATGCIEAAAQGGGYILSSACSVSPRTPPENLTALAEVVEKEGIY